MRLSLRLHFRLTLVSLWTPRFCLLRLVRLEFHLIDVSSGLPQLIRRPGLTAWRPTADKQVKATYESYDAFVAAEPQAATTTKLTPGHWPPSNVEELNLDRW